MARIKHDDKIEVFAYAESGLRQALVEAAIILRESKGHEAIDETKATLEYREGAFYIGLPYVQNSPHPGPDDPDEEYDHTEEGKRRGW